MLSELCEIIIIIRLMQMAVRVILARLALDLSRRAEHRHHEVSGVGAWDLLRLALDLQFG
jgi:hypothetical protein